MQLASGADAWISSLVYHVIHFDNCRSSGISMMHKKAKVEFHPLGVVGAIVSWNYPFHNIFNPMLAAVFSGNSIVIKVYSYKFWLFCKPSMIW